MSTAWLGDEGVKFDNGKLRLNLIPPEAFESIGEVLTIGAEKYGERNWEKGISEDRLVGALLRHLVAHRLGNLQDESGLNHLDHVLCNAMFLSVLFRRKML